MITGGHFLDGREFKGTMVRVGAQPSNEEDVLTFRDGKLHSKYLALLGFPEETPYVAYLEKEASEADRLLVKLNINNTNADEFLSLKAIVKGNDIDIRLELKREGNPPEFLYFTGSAKPMFRNDYYSLGA